MRIRASCSSMRKSWRIRLQGPKGAQGVPLTRGRSIAVDPASVPLGGAGVSGYDVPGNGSAAAETGDGAGHRRRDPRRR